MQLVDAAGALEDFHHLIDVLRAIRREENLERIFHQFFLVGGKFADGHAGKFALLPLQRNIGFAGGFGDEGLGGLLRVEGLEDLVGLLRLIVEQVFLGIFVAVAIDDGTTEGGFVRAVAVGPQGEVAAGQFPLELAAAGRAEQGDAVRAEAAVVVLGLLLDPLVAVGAGDFLHDFVNQGLLVLGVERAFNHRLGDVPVGANPRAKRVFKFKADRLLLLVAEQAIQPGDRPFRLALLTRCGMNKTRKQSRPRRGSQRCSADGPHKRAAAQVRFTIRAGNSGALVHGTLQNRWEGRDAAIVGLCRRQSNQPDGKCI